MGFHTFVSGRRLVFSDDVGIGRRRDELSNLGRNVGTGVPAYTPAMERGPVARRIGVLGGTFDPPHVGHLVTAVNVRHLLDLDVVLMVVANEPWQKVSSRAVTPADHRLAMVRSAVDDVDGVQASDIEIRRGGPSYSVDTLHALQRAHPDAELFLIVGADAAAELHTWRRPEEVARLCRLVVVDRPGVGTVLPDGFDGVRVEVPRLEVSSTDLRARVVDGRPLRFLVPDPVVSLVRELDLYRDRR
jgi:nicotinate-nucleotide adenylyltransferase